ncbi:uncharacterized protein [Linepithema humile]|uniref:uncharacterized protein n=1 Tax=Linepithema humile TaxID=83485 RepID=UPI00351F67DF
MRLGINTKVGSVDENTHTETAAQNEGCESFENEDTRMRLGSFIRTTNFVNENENNGEANTQSNDYNFLENSEVLITLDMFYDVTSTNFDHCVKKLNFSDYAADVCIPTIIQNTTTCNKENTSITCNKENTSITCNEENTSITCNKENTSITCNKENTSTTCNKENINLVPLSVLSPISSPVPALHDNVDKKNSSESEYLPSEDELRSLEYDYNKKLQQKKKVVLNTTVASVSSGDVSIGNIISACNDEDMYVEKSNTKALKQNYCYFCSKLQTQLPRHLEIVHRNEPEVKKFAMLSKGNPERRKIIDISNNRY